MGDKIVKSKNLCCQPVVFPSLSLLMKTEAENQDVPKYVVEENPGESSESQEDSALEDSSNDSSEEAQMEFPEDGSDLQVCNFKYRKFSFKLLFATFFYMLTQFKDCP